MNSKVFQRMQKNLGKISNVQKEFKRTDGTSMYFKPFFNSITIKEIESHNMDLFNGSVSSYQKTQHNPFKGRLETRMGDYEKGGGVDYETFDWPKNLNKEACSKAFDVAAKESFWECAKDWVFRDEKALGKNQKDRAERYDYFSKEKPEYFIQNEKDFNVKDFEKFGEQLEKISKKIKKPWLMNLEINVKAQKENTYFLNTEGSKIFTSNVESELFLFARGVDGENYIIPNFHRWFGEKFPDLNEIENKGHYVISELEEILKAPVQKSGLFPAILDQVSMGVKAHEFLGHFLEGHRFQRKAEDDEDSGSNNSLIFKDKLGQKIAPNFVNLWDDPSMERSKNGEYINGHYLFDEEGVKSQRVQLINNGILTNYLHSRGSAGFYGIHSNGHSRSNGTSDPVPRMGNIIIKSSNPVKSFNELKKGLIKECERQGTDYGLYFQDFYRGEASPKDGFFNAFPKNAFRIYRNGGIKRVKRAHFGGEAWGSLDKIIAMDNNYVVGNGYCGAESGDISSSQIAPNGLVRELPVKESGEDEFRKTKEPIIDEDDYEE